MGMFDDLTYRGHEYQTKSLDCTLDQYEIRADGTLWHETYRTEDQSDPNATGLMRFVGVFARVPTGWERVMHTGEVRFYRALDRGPNWKWEEFVAFYADGELIRLLPVTDADASQTPAQPVENADSQP